MTPVLTRIVFLRGSAQGKNPTEQPHRQHDLDRAAAETIVPSGSAR
jgi:hypothetical protein